jgi:DNA-binding NtrC family response regulator
MRLIAESVAGTQVPVRIEGERGTGKTLVARRLHTLSARRDLPLLVLDAARTPPEGSVAALFGDERSCGAVRAASGATLLVRSVQRLDGRAQNALARWLRSGVVPEGPFAHERSDARLLVTSHEPLDVLAAHGKFLADLAAALSTVVVRVPPLRERRGDAALLFAHFLQASGQEPPKLTDDATALFDQHPWRGNAEEVAALAALVAARGPFPSLDAAALRPLLAFPGPAPGGGAGEAECPASLDEVPTLAELTSGHVIRVLALAGGVRSRAAKALGISPRTLYNHLQGLALGSSRGAKVRSAAGPGPAVRGGAEATLPRTR